MRGGMGRSGSQVLTLGEQQKQVDGQGDIQDSEAQILAWLRAAMPWVKRRCVIHKRAMRAAMPAACSGVRLVTKGDKNNQV